MFGLFTKSAHRPRPSLGTSLRVERLDDRITPVVIDTFEFQRIDANTFRLYGHVSDPQPLGLVVYFGGEVMAAQKLDAPCDAYGNYTVTFTRASTSDAGIITADCMTWWGEHANELTLDLPS